MVHARAGIVRRAVVADALRISELLCSLAPFLADGPAAELPARLAQSFGPEAVAKRLGQAEYRCYVCEQGSDICAYLAMRDGNYLYHLFTAEAYQRQGLARDLWLHAVTETAAPVIKLSSSIYAVPVYQCLGFECAGEPSDFEGYRYQPMRWRRKY